MLFHIFASPFDRIRIEFDKLLPNFRPNNRDTAKAAIIAISFD